MRLIALYSRYFAKKIFIILYLAFFVLLFIALREHDFYLYSVLIPNPFYDYFSQYSTFIYSVLIFTIFGFTTSLLEIVLAFTNSTAKIAVEKRKAYIHKYINETLFDHIINKKDLEKDKIYIRKIKRQFRFNYPRKIFINRLRRIMILTTGDVHEHCIQLFFLMNANNLLWSYLHSPFPRHKLFALQIIGEFKVTRFNRIVNKLMYKKNPIISSEAMYAYLRLYPQTHFNFLLKRKRPISKLDFYKFVKIAADYKDIDYDGLISSSIPMISALGIRFAGKHGITDMKNSIFKKIEHENENVHNEAQNAFLLLLEDEDVNFIFEKFDIFTLKNKLKILEMLSHYASNPKVVNFLHKIIETYDFQLKIAAMSVLLNKNTVEIIRYRNYQKDEVIANVYNQLIDFNL